MADARILSSWKGGVEGGRGEGRGEGEGKAEEERRERKRTRDERGGTRETRKDFLILFVLDICKLLRGINEAKAISGERCEPEGW